MEALANFLGSFEFATPFYFWIAGALVLFLIFLPWAMKRRGFPVDLQYWKRKVAFKSRRAWALSIPVVIVSILMAGVLSDPRTTEKPITYIYGHPVMVVLDISVSMGAGHTDQTSFSNAVEAFNELTARKSDINFGLLLFSTKNYIARYFINKNELFKDTLENMGEIIQMSQGTQIAKALVKAQLFLADKIKGDDKTIILISDMDVASSDWKNIVDELTSISLAGMNTYIVGTGLGTQWAANIPQISGLKIMDVTGIDQICAEISAMQISPIREEEGLLKKSMIQFFILPALGVITLCLILGATRFRKIP